VTEPRAADAAAEQKVTWSELFVDLVWVFGVTQIAAALAHGHGLGDVGRSLLLLVPLWWSWVGTTVFGNAAGARLEHATGRLVLFAVAGCGLGIAVAVPHAYADRGLLFAGSYAVLRLVLWLAMRRLPFYDGVRVNPFGVMLFVSAPLYLVGALLPADWRLAVWVLAAATEVLAPRVLRRSVSTLRFETAHLPERFGLFIIIAIGETVVAMGTQAAGHHHVDLAVLGTLALSFVLICGLWWTYFHFGSSAMRHALRTTTVQGGIVRDVFSYAHLAYVTGIICVAVGLKQVLAHPEAIPHSVPELMLAPGAALYLAGFGYSRWRMFGAPTLFRTAASLLCVMIALAAPLLPLVATAAAVTALTVGLNVLEFFWVRSNRPLLLVPVPGSRRAG